ncbi:CvpA family protein [Fulvivirga sedimenti]|uniref:CvpA family protein n=1 Tax=Fulvivirga sedimenti TaxID=2879465 RepID=A0A9X1HQF5_9BACT|nr:CvpA family protein [Fulvivirga sedimenti]MCA6074429.1 CvpA family protein [Fulvivirga sedimenti]
MSVLDIVLLVPLIVGAYSGFREGFLHELFSILAFIIGLLAAFKLLHVGIELLRDNFNLDGAWLPLISFVGIFIVVLILTKWVGKALKSVVHATPLGAVDKLAGAVLALFKFALGVSVVLWVLDTFGISLPETWTEGSLLYPYLRPMSEELMSWIAVVLPFANDLFDSLRSEIGI